MNGSWGKKCISDFKFTYMQIYQFFCSLKKNDIPGSKRNLHTCKVSRNCNCTPNFSLRFFQSMWTAQQSFTVVCNGCAAPRPIIQCQQFLSQAPIFLLSCSTVWTVIVRFKVCLDEHQLNQCLITLHNQRVWPQIATTPQRHFNHILRTIIIVIRLEASSAPLLSSLPSSS